MTSPIDHPTLTYKHGAPKRKSYLGLLSSLRFFKVDADPTRLRKLSASSAPLYHSYVETLHNSISTRIKQTFGMSPQTPRPTPSVTRKTVTYHL